MLLKALIKNPLDGEQKPWKPWYGYFLLAVLVVSGGLYVYQRVNGGPVVPTFTDPATVYENAKTARERQTLAAVVHDEAIDAALSDVARAALALMETAPIVLPDIESFSGDAVEMATWIEQTDVALNATVIEDPSIEEIETYVLQHVPVLIPVMFEEEIAQHWVVLDASSRDVVMLAMVGRYIVIVMRT